MSHIKNPLNNKTILSITISEDKETINFDCVEGKVIGECYGDCCSHTWIEHVEYPALGYPAKVLNVEDLGLVRSEDDHPEHNYLQLYGYKISTEKGDLIVDFRNSSNGYYGGSLEWTFKPKETNMSTTDKTSAFEIEHSCPVEVAPPLFDSKGNATPYYKSLPRAERKAMWADKTHPSFTAAQVASNERKAKQQDKAARLKQVSEFAGYRFLAIGRLTVCYRRAKNVLYISTTLRNAKDVDSPLDAKLGAAYRMAQGEYIVVPIHSKNSAKHAVRDLFFFVPFV